ncbi:MAG: 3-hydroxyacyl-CoA dehydrogenase family protein [Acidobacteriota bacterium]
MHDEAIRDVVVIGAGTMGHGIAHVAAAAGCQVFLLDVDPGAVQAGLARVEAHLARGVELGKVTDAQRRDTLSRLRGGTEPAERVPGADLIIEAVPEDLDLKIRVLSEVGGLVGDTALVATNTSSLPLSSMSRAVPAPERFIGLHFFNPPHRMRLVEIVVAEQTSAATTDTACALVARFGKEAIVVRDSPGFATSRLGLIIGLEAMRMVESGVASVADIDRAMELGYNHPMGPLKLSDLVGLDVRLGISETLARELDEVRFRPPAILRDKVRAGHLGKKTGEGFYRWTDDGPRPVD